MSGRNGLTWVTALTIASLLLGSGALNALAEGHGGGEHGGGSGRGNAGHQPPAPIVNSGVNQNKHDGEGGSNHPSPPVHTVLQVPAPAQGTHGNDDKNSNGSSADNNHGDKDNNNDDNVNRKHDDDDDLVTKPARVTDDARPCRDDDDHKCNNGNDDHNKGNGDGDGGDHGATNPDASTVTVADADADAVDATDN
jgi:hypothetical protein